jgi:hypothetical protein
VENRRVIAEFETSTAGSAAIINLQMQFADAIERFQRFLGDQGHSGPLVWITPSDLMWSGGTLIIRPRAEAKAESERMFHQATERGYGVALEAVARVDHSICCFVFVPGDAEDAASNFVAPPLTMKVRQDFDQPTSPAPSDGGLSKKWHRTRTNSRTTILWTRS